MLCFTFVLAVQLAALSSYCDASADTSVRPSPSSEVAVVNAGVDYRQCILSSTKLPITCSGDIPINCSAPGTVDYVFQMRNTTAAEFQNVTADDNKSCLSANYTSGIGLYTFTPGDLDYRRAFKCIAYNANGASINEIQVQVEFHSDEKNTWKLKSGPSQTEGDVNLPHSSGDSFSAPQATGVCSSNFTLGRNCLEYTVCFLDEKESDLYDVAHTPCLLARGVIRCCRCGSICPGLPNVTTKATQLGNDKLACHVSTSQVGQIVCLGKIVNSNDNSQYITNQVIGFYKTVLSSPHSQNLDLPEWSYFLIVGFSLLAVCVTMIAAERYVRQRNRRPEYHVVHNDGLEGMPGEMKEYQRPHFSRNSAAVARTAEIYNASSSQESQPSVGLLTHEEMLEKTCWMPFGFQTHKVAQSNSTEMLYLVPGTEEIYLEVPGGAVMVPSLEVRTAVIACGPMFFPGTLQLASMVVYVDFKAESVSSSLILHLPDWRRKDGTTKSRRTVIRAEHEYDHSLGGYQFKVLPSLSGMWPGSDSIPLSGHCSMYADAIREGESSSYYLTAYKCDEEEKNTTRVQVVVTFQSDTWLKIFERYHLPRIGKGYKRMAQPHSFEFEKEQKDPFLKVYWEKPQGSDELDWKGIISDPDKRIFRRKVSLQEYRSLSPAPPVSRFIGHRPRNPGPVYQKQRLENAVENGTYPPTKTCEITFASNFREGRVPESALLLVSGVENEEELLSFKCPPCQRKGGPKGVASVPPPSLPPKLPVVEGVASGSSSSLPPKQAPVVDVPATPRTRMDEEIGSSLDIIGEPKYSKGLMSQIPLLGKVLGIGDYTDAILTRGGTVDTQLMNVLDRYIKEKIPTWRDFCKALEKYPIFKKVRQEIEADHHSGQL